MYLLVITVCIIFPTTLTLVGSAAERKLSLHPDFGLNTVQLVEKHGYPIESHEVETEDGYLLTMYRIPHGRIVKSTTSTKAPVLLMHGLFSNSADWVNMGPQKALAYMLVDAGYDVWLGNQRGTTWSKKHKYLDPDTDREKFFSFSLHELGVYDLPALIDHIIDTTNHTSVNYVGHSQGTHTFFIMAAARSEYNNKIRLMSALAPVVHLGNIEHPLVRFIVKYKQAFTEFFLARNWYDVLPYTDFIKLLGVTCSDNSPGQWVCILVYAMIGGMDMEQLDPNFLSVILSNDPAGAGIRQVEHFLQEINSTQFCQYDYGTEVNYQKYGQSSPPLYNISKITAPVSLHYAEKDLFTPATDVLRLSEELPNLRSIKAVPFKEFDHMDFLFAKDVVELINEDVLAEIEAENSK